MSVTDETSHPEMSWLKQDASWNMCAMLVTEETSHPEMFRQNKTKGVQCRWVRLFAGYLDAKGTDVSSSDAPRSELQFEIYDFYLPDFF